MDDLLEDMPGDNAPEFTVSELSGAVKRTIEGAFDNVRVRGELGRVSRPRSGHVYLDVKDDRACLAGVIWRGKAAGLSMEIEEGMEVVVTGRLTTFPGQSKYQIVIDSIAPAGVGALMAMLEKRKKALEAEGLFAAERKRATPFLPEVIGVVTSPSGAVIRDILHRLRERFPRHVLIWPVAVQGAACAPEVARAIEGFNAIAPGGPIPRPDLLIVARGGGSIEDLWGFNEEAVARAAAASEIPLISAVGHETDTTLIDFVADKRAPTPSAAAEMAVPVRRELLAWSDGQGARLVRALNLAVTRRQERLRDLGRALPRPDELTAPARQRLDWVSGRLPAALRTAVAKQRHALTEASAVLRPSTLRSRVAQAKQWRDAAVARLTGRGRTNDINARRRHLEQVSRGLRRDAALRLVGNRRDTLGRSGGRLTRPLIARRVSAQREGLAQHSAALGGVAERRTGALRQRLETLERVRLTTGYEATLARGYAVVWSDATLVTDTEAARRARTLEIQFADGRVAVGSGSGSSRSKPRQTPPKQGSLL